MRVIKFKYNSDMYKNVVMKARLFLRVRRGNSSRTKRIKLKLFKECIIKALGKLVEE